MILYRTSGPWGAGVGASLTADQVDGNFYDVSQRVQYLELHPQEPVLITSFTATGNQLYIHMSDGTVNGPITLPVVRWFFRGPWKTSTGYLVDDVVIGPDSVVYLVVFSHTSSTSTFDPRANDGHGNNYYSVLLQQPAAVLPTGGGAGYVLTKSTTANYDVMWGLPSAPAGGSTGQVLQKNSAVNGDASWHFLKLDDLKGNVAITAAPSDWDYLRWNAATSRWVNQPSVALNVLSATSWSPGLSDAGAFMVLQNGIADATVAIPSNASVPFQIGTELTVHQDGTGLVTVMGESGVTVLKHASFSNRLLGQYATATVKKTAADVWRLFGLLAGA